MPDGLRENERFSSESLLKLLFGLSDPDAPAADLPRDEVDDRPVFFDASPRDGLPDVLDLSSRPFPGFLNTICNEFNASQRGRKGTDI